MSAFAGKADIATFFRYPCSRHYDPLVRLTPGAGLVRILSYLRLSTVLALCSLPNVVELGVNRGNLGFISSALGQPTALTKSQTDVLNSYSKTVQDFRSLLSERRAQINAKQKLPDVPGQALYLARVNMMGAYKDLTDVMPSRIGRPNKFKIPPAYFDADNEPLIDEYRKLFDLMEAPPADAQKSDTPFKDVVDLGTAIARARGLDATHAEAAGRVSLGIFFAETNGNQNIGNARSNKYKGSMQTGVSEGQGGQRKWAALRPAI